MVDEMFFFFVFLVDELVGSWIFFFWKACGFDGGPEVTEVGTVDGWFAYDNG